MLREFLPLLCLGESPGLGQMGLGGEKIHGEAGVDVK